MTIAVDSLLLSAIAGFCGGSGSLFAKYITDRITHRSDQLRKLVIETESSISSLVKLIDDYYSPESDKTSANEIIQQIRDISALVNLAGSWYPKCRRKLDNAMLNFHRCATGGEFGGNSRTYSVQTILDVHSAATALRIVLKDVSRKYYQII